MSRPKGVKNKPKKQVVKKQRQIKEVIQNLDEIFEVDEIINLDEIEEEKVINVDKTDTALPKKDDTLSVSNKNQSHSELNFEEKLQNAGEFILDNGTEIKANIDNEDVIEYNLKFFRNIYLLYPQVNDTFEEFSIKFRYYLISYNLDTHNLTQRHVMRFIKHYGNYNLEECKKVLGL